MSTCNTEDSCESRPTGLLRAACWLVCALPFVGCIHNEYELVLEPDGESLNRSITFWRNESRDAENKITAFPEEELRKIAQAYGEQAPAAAAEKYAFRGKFRGVTPQDLGGSGGYTRWPTEMGALFLYAERFRGDDDLARSLDERRLMARDLSELLLDWFRSEIGDDPDFNKLQAFFEQQFERDLENVAVYFWSAAAVAASTFDGDKDGDAVGDELLVRLGRYFVERGYFAADELPRLVRMVNQDDATRLLEFARTVLATKLAGDKADVKDRLKFLSDPQTAAESLAKYVRDTLEFQDHLKEWRREHADQPDETPPEPLDYVGELAVGLTGFELRAYDQLRVTLKCPVEPFSTNGVWDEATQSIAWSTDLNAADERPFPVVPALPFAAWSVPESGFQRKHFGKVVLQGRALGEYCLWRLALTEQEAREWDTFVADLTPEDDIRSRLDAFRFSNDPLPDPEGDDSLKSLADTPRGLIQSNL